MAKKVKDAPTQAQANVGEIFSRSEKFIETYKNPIIISVVAIIVIVLAVIGARQYYFLPKENEARTAIFPGQNYFENQQWELALNGDSVSYSGFLGIIEDYGITKTAKLANRYAGTCYYYLHQPEEALKYLKKFKTSDKLIAATNLSLIGDCYVDLGKVGEGVGYFKKAADKANSEILSPKFLFKAGTAYENLADYKNALDVYNTIKNKYPNSVEASSIEKYIDRASLQIK